LRAQVYLRWICIFNRTRGILLSQNHLLLEVSARQIVGKTSFSSTNANNKNSSIVIVNAVDQSVTSRVQLNLEIASEVTF
jgi:hypothetical protein